MPKFTRYKIPILLSIFAFSILVTFQRCGKSGGSDSGTSTSASTISSGITSAFAPDSYFIEYSKYNGTNDSILIGFVLGENQKFTGYMVRFLNGDYRTGYYQISKGTYKFTTQNRFEVSYIKDTCNDLSPDVMEISGSPGDTVYLKQDSTSFKFLSEKSWSSKSGFTENNAALIEDIECKMF